MSDTIFGRRPRSRTGKHLGLKQVGMPIPVRRLLIGRPGQNRTDFCGLSDRSSAIELQDIIWTGVRPLGSDPSLRFLGPQQGIEPWSSGLEAEALPLSY